MYRNQETEKEEAERHTEAEQGRNRGETDIDRGETRDGKREGRYRVGRAKLKRSEE